MNRELLIERVRWMIAEKMVPHAGVSRSAEQDERVLDELARDLVAVFEEAYALGEPSNECDTRSGLHSPGEMKVQGEPSDAAVRAAGAVLYEDWEHFDFDDPDDWEDAAYAQVRAALRAAAETGPQGEPSARDLLDAIYDPEEDSESDSVRIGFVVEQYERLRGEGGEAR